MNICLLLNTKQSSYCSSYGTNLLPIPCGIQIYQFNANSVDPDQRAPVLEPSQSLTLSPPNTLSSAKPLVCFNFQSASTSPKVGENVVQVSNSLDQGETAGCRVQGETLSYLASHPDPSCLHMAFWICLAG